MQLLIGRSRCLLRRGRVRSCRGLEVLVPRLFHAREGILPSPVKENILPSPGNEGFQPSTRAECPRFIVPCASAQRYPRRKLPAGGMFSFQGNAFSGCCPSGVNLSPGSAAGRSRRNPPRTVQTCCRSQSKGRAAIPRIPSSSCIFAIPPSSSRPACSELSSIFLANSCASRSCSGRSR